MPERAFTLKWRNGGNAWTGRIEPDTVRGNESPQILRESDVALASVMEWLAAEQIDVDDPALESEIDFFLGYLIEHMRPNSPRLPPQETFAAISRGSTIDWLPPARPARTITKWVSFLLLWLLFARLSLHTYRRSLSMRRRNAELWLSGVRERSK